MLLLGLALLSLSPALLYADTTISSDSSSAAVQEAIVNMSSRTDGSAYSIKDSDGTSRTPWIEDFFNIFKYYEVRRDEREAYFYYMRPPSLPYFTSIFSTARQNYMFLPSFSYYDGISGLSKSVENNYLYIYKMDTYDELIKPNFIDAALLAEAVAPSETGSMTRAGTSFQTGDGIFDELVRASAVQDAVFKHFYLYCPEGQSDLCNVVMDATSGGVFDSAGMGTTRPNADINPESLLSSPSFAIESSGHHGAKDFIRMISNPTPKFIVPFKTDANQPGAYVPDTSDIKQIGKNLTDAAYRNLSAHVLNEIKNRRIQSVNPKDSSSSSSSGSLSMLEFLHSSATDRLLTSNNWLTQMNVTSSEGLLRELVMIQASALLLQYQQFKQSENIEALLAAIVAQNQNMLDSFNFGPDTAKIQDSIAAVS